MRKICLLFFLLASFQLRAQLTGIKVVGAGGDYPTLTAAVAALNAQGPGAGGVTFNIKGGHTETVANGIASPQTAAGLLITRGGTAANPVVIKWDGSGTKPTFMSGVGIYWADFVIGIAGQDYITLDGLKIVDNPTHANNNQRAEIGIGLFKERYNTTLGNNGCQYVTIKNCEITLTRYPNSFQKRTNVHFPLTSSGIMLSHMTSNFQGSTSVAAWSYSNPNQGIKSATDVHSHNVIISNKIDNCVNGIRIGDAWLQSGSSLFAGTGNVIGRSGEGNQITNFGPLSTVSYDGRTADGKYNQSAMPGIEAGGQKDILIEYNTVSGCTGGGTTSVRYYTGIHVGMSAGGAFALPRSALSNFKINNNTISNIDATNGTQGRHSIGINFVANPDAGQIAKGGGNIEIKNNTISNLSNNMGNVMGIGGNYAQDYIQAYQRNDGAAYQSTGNVTINGNIFTNLSRASNVSNATLTVIYWRHGSKNLYINNNQLSNITYGTAGTTPVASSPGLMGIYVNSQYNNVVRELVEIKNNVIDNASVLAASTSRNPVSFGMITVHRGGATNVVANNQIKNCNLYNSANTTANFYNSLIWVRGQPKSGASTVSITGNSLTNNARTGLYSNSNTGYGSPFIGIFTDYIGGNQTRTISGNTIENLSQSANASHSQVAYSIIRGIYSKGRTTFGNSTTISGNTIKGISGVSSAYTQQAAYNTTALYWRYPMAGIIAEEFNQLTIKDNNISNMESTSSAWWVEANSVSGPTGIAIYNSTAARNTTSNIVNNFISDLRAPIMWGRLAINGIVLTGSAFKHNVYHNTITIGSIGGGTTGRVTSTAGSFGVTGILISTTIHNDKRYLQDIRNNIISINATAKGLGSNMGIRSLTLTAVKKVPLSIDKASNGNVYFINSDPANYIYGQGAIYNTTGGIRNAFAFSGATTNAAQNLVNDGVNFNTTCGLYKTFMAGAEKESAVDISGSTITTLPFVGTGTVPDNLKVTTGSTSAVYNARRITTPLLVDKDYFQTARGATQVTAGAHEASGTSTVSEIAFDFEGVEDGVCQENKSLAVTITAPTGKTIQATGTNAPRLYYRRIMNASAITAAQSDNNVMPSAADNNASGVEGWRWVQATSNSGDVFNFIVDMALLKSTIVTTPSYTIEYFVGAQTTDGTKAGFSSGDWSLNVTAGSSTCPGTVALDTYTVPPVPADPLATTLDDNSVTDNFTVYSGAQLTKTAELAQTSVCTGGNVGVIAHYKVTATGAQIGSSYRFQVANDAAFTSGLQEFNQADSVFNYTTTSNTTKYIRSWLVCGTTLVANSNTNAVTVTVNNVPVNTSTIASRNSCENVAQSFSLASTSDPTNQSRFYWLVSPKLKVFNNAPAANTTASSTLSVTPGSSDHSGTWNSYVTTSAAGTLATAGYKTVSLDGSETGKFEPGAGLAFTANQFIKLNSVKVKDALDDEGATSVDDFYVRLYTKDGYLLYSQTVTTDIGNGAILTVTLTNWYIAPGDYILVMEAVAAEPEAGYSSSLVFAPGTDFPIDNPAAGTTAFSVTGGVAGLAFDEDSGEASFDENSDYNYFFDLNVSTYCTSNVKPFEWTINPASCCSATPPAVGTIANATTSPELSSNDCKLVNGWYYYFDPAAPTKLLFAINPNGNTFNPSSVVVDNSGAVADASHKVTTTGYHAELMPYIAKFATDDELTVNGGIKVRVFYPAAQKTAVDAGTYDVTSWFAYPGSKDDVLSNLSGTGIESSTLLTPSATGTENSIPYVEFENITSSSAFGYVRFDRALKVKAKVLLQGAMPATGATMRNDLQNYLNDNGVALLPTVNPYGLGSFYNQINNQDGTAGHIVDWVMVELRSAADPATVLAKGAFLLKTDGTVVDTLGNAELTFSTAVEQEPMHLVIHHRNHLPVMSPVISTFPLDVLEHDFTTGLAKAFNSGGDPDQLVQVNAKWTMIAGDVNPSQNYVIDVADKTIVQLDFNGGLFDEYLKSDLTMDGVVDIRDLALANANFLQGYYSSLANY